MTLLLFLSFLKGYMGKNDFFNQRETAASEELPDGIVEARASCGVKPSLAGRGRAGTSAKGNEADPAEGGARNEIITRVPFRGPGRRRLQCSPPGPQTEGPGKRGKSVL